jgi:type VI secretion system protein ImpJ
MTKNRHRVVWTRGMFLNPQQFQAQDRFLESTLNFRFNASNFSNWGVTELAIDADAVENGKFRVIQASGIMPDGEPFEMPDADDIPAERSIKEHFPPTRNSVDVFLAIPEARARNVDIANAGQSNGMSATRYVAETLMVNDENTGDEQKPVQVARRTFRLLFEDEYRDGFSYLRIARITRSAAGAMAPDSQFVAPCLNLSSSSCLEKILRGQIEKLIAKSTVLSGQVRQRGKNRAEYLPSDTEVFWQLHTVNSFIPELKHIWKVRKGHPEQAYVAMLRLAGALSTFSLESRPENLPDYDHDDLGGCFTLLDANIRELLDIIHRSNLVTLPLDPRDRLLWGAAVPEEEYFKDSQFYLAVAAKMGMDDVIRRVPQLIKVSSQDDIHRLVKNALPGITLRHVPAPPNAIHARLETQYFSLNQAGPLWDAIRLSRQIAVHAPGEVVEPRMEILIVFE